MRKLLVEAVNALIEAIEQENDDISLGDESIPPFIIHKIIITKDFRPWQDSNVNWIVYAKNMGGRAYKYAWYVDTESGVIIADGV